jgi:pimeloyl-ACP methyl ester carboxylesterase
MLFFRSPEAEAFFLDNEAAGLRSLYEVSGLTDFDEYMRVLTQPGAMTGALNWYRGVDRSVAAEMKPVTTPTLYVWSTNDPALGREAAEATAGYARGPYQFEVLDGVGHWIPEEAPDALSALLLEHLGGESTRRP